MRPRIRKRIWRLGPVDSVAEAEAGLLTARRTRHLAPRRRRNSRGKTAPPAVSFADRVDSADSNARPKQGPSLLICRHPGVNQDRRGRTPAAVVLPDPNRARSTRSAARDASSGCHAADVVSLASRRRDHAEREEVEDARSAGSASTSDPVIREDRVAPSGACHA
jgi:hypothetical protein